jgi:hypothetical protein
MKGFICILILCSCTWFIGCATADSSRYTTRFDADYSMKDNDMTISFSIHSR